MPSRPILQVCAKTVGPSPSMCSLNRMPALALATIDARAALRFAVQLDQVKTVEEYALVSALVPNEIERGNAIVVAGDSFAVDDAGALAQACALTPGAHDLRDAGLNPNIS
jgi:hypothetical protein